MILKLSQKLYLAPTSSKSLEVVDSIQTDRPTFELKTLSNFEFTVLATYTEGARAFLQGENTDPSKLEALIKEVSKRTKIHGSEIKAEQLDFASTFAIASKLIEESVLSMEDKDFLL